MLEKNKYSLRNITNPKITKYIDQKYKPLDQRLWRMRLESEGKYIPIIQRDVETMLISYLSTSKPKRILELGTAIGYSSLVMAKLMKDLGVNTEILTIERHPDMIKLAKKNIADFTMEENIKIIEEDCLKALKDLNSKGEYFDFVFVDAGKSHYLEFYEEIKTLVNRGSLVFCDNIFMRGMTVDATYDIHDKHRTSIKNMRRFLDVLMSDNACFTSLLPVGDGVTVSCFK